MGKYLFGGVFVALGIFIGLRIYEPYYDSSRFRQALDDVTLSALEKDDAAVKAEIMRSAGSLDLGIAPTEIRIERSPDNRSVEIHVEYQGAVDMILARFPVEFTARARRELSFPAMIIRRSREKTEGALKEHEKELEEKINPP